MRKSVKSNHRTRRTLEKRNEIISFFFFKCTCQPTLGIGNTSHLPGVQVYPENEMKEDKNRLICMLQLVILKQLKMLRTISSILRISTHNNTELSDKMTKTTTWLWRWLPHRLSKRQSLTTVLLRTPVTQMILFNHGMLLLGSNHFLNNNKVF